MIKTISLAGSNQWNASSLKSAKSTNTFWLLVLTDAAVSIWCSIQTKSFLGSSNLKSMKWCIYPVHGFVWGTGSLLQTKTRYVHTDLHLEIQIIYQLI